MKSLPDNSIPLTVTSPPYDSIRDYDGYSFDFPAIAEQLYRITKLGGVVVWVVADGTIKGSESGTSFRQALGFLDIGFRLHDTMIYQKANPQPNNARRYEPSFEFMFVLSKGKPTTFNPLLLPCKMAGRINAGTRRHDPKGVLEAKDGNGKPYKPTKPRPNIWTYAVGSFFHRSDPLCKLHPATFPLELAKDHISSWSNEGDLILDPMVGSGQTAIAAMQLGRKYIGFDCSQEYCDLAQKRLEWYREKKDLHPPR